MKNSRLRSLVILTAMLAVVSGCGGEKVAEEDLPEIEIGVNLITNPSFEEWNGFMPVGWDVRLFAGEGKNINMYGRNRDWFITGENSYFLRGLFNTEKWMVLSQRHPVRPGYEVYFSGMIKTAGIEKSKGQEDNAGLFIIFYNAEGERVNDRYYADSWTSRRVGTGPWSKNENKIEVPDGARTMEVGLINQMTGYIYFDDIEVRFLEKLKWEEKKTKFVTYQWDLERPIPADDLQREIDLVKMVVEEARIKDIEGRIYYRMYPSEQKFMDVTGRKRYRKYTSWTKKTLHTTDSFEDHEMIHLVLYDLGVPPMGVAKGLVFYFRSKFNGWDIHNAAKQDLAAKRLPGLYRTVSKESFDDSNLQVTVPGWASFVTWLIDRYGMNKVLDLYTSTNEIDEIGPFEVRFKDVFGDDFKKLDQEWRWFLLRYECDAAADTIF
ncbi:MAG: hypothetical protein KAV42_03495 [Candidatus Krumholzibacteria bacterium]|nr:hypothetical protein [Candidatus Krumholzibacteria bacterium]